MLVLIGADVPVFLIQVQQRICIEETHVGFVRVGDVLSSSELHTTNVQINMELQKYSQICNRVSLRFDTSTRHHLPHQNCH